MLFLWFLRVLRIFFVVFEDFVGFFFVIFYFLKIEWVLLVDLYGFGLPSFGIRAYIGFGWCSLL